MSAIAYHLGRVGALTVLGLGVWSQPLRSQDSPQPPVTTPQILQQNDDRNPAPLPELEPLPPDPPDIDPPTFPFEIPDDVPTTVTIRSLNVVGSTVFGAAELADLVNALPRDRPIPTVQLQDLATQITERYLANGYVNSFAKVDWSSVTTGEIEINITEGTIADILIEGTQRLDPDYIRDRLRLGIRRPVQYTALEAQLRQLQHNPLLQSIEASLSRGEDLAPDESLLLVRVVEADPVTVAVGMDNFTPPTVGSERVTVKGKTLNLTGIGDQLIARHNRTFEAGLETWELSYRLPLNARNGSLFLRGAWQRNEVIQDPFAVLEIRGNSETYEVSWHQPLRQTDRESLGVSLGFAYQTGQTFTFAGGTPFGFGPEADGRTTTSVIKLGQDYVRRDRRGAWGARSQFSLGVDWLGATMNEGNSPDSRFLSWLAQVQRVQVLHPNHVLVIAADLQLSTAPLLSGQQFVVGGGQSVRGYRQNVRSGDNGLHVTLEDRWTVERDNHSQPELWLRPFVDLGWVWSHPDNPNPLPEERLILGTGLGVTWQIDRHLVLDVDYGFPLVELRDRGTDAQDEGVHFNLNYQF